MRKIPVTQIESSTQGTRGSIRIVDRISEWTESSSLTIKGIVDSFIAKGITHCEVYINSAGGNVFEATEIVNDLKRIPNVTLQIGSLAASAATYIMTKFTATGFPNSQFMIHRPSITTSGNVADLKADLKLLENITADYVKAYAEKMKKSEQEIEDYFAKGDYWMNAQEAKELGLLDAILTEQEHVTSESIQLLVAVAAPKIPQIINQIQNKMDRNKLISRLKLSADATDAEIESALAAIEIKASRAETLETEISAQMEAQATAMVEKAILDKKITADLKDTYLSLAKKDLKGTEAALAAMQGAQKASEHLEGNPGADASKEKWTLEDYQEKDPAALEEMITKDPEKFKKLEAAYFGE